VYFHTISHHLPMAVILQSDIESRHSDNVTRGRFDILTGAPEYWLTSRNGATSMCGENPPAIDVADSSLANLHALIALMENSPVDYSACIAESLPFCGGLLGFCSYDLAREYIPLINQCANDIDIPDMQFGFYGWACIQDHHKQRSWLVIHPACNSELSEKLQGLLPAAATTQTHKNIEQSDFHSIGNFSSNISETHYKEKFSRIQNYIQAGDCYQINMAQRFQSDCRESAESIYWHLRGVMPSPFCTFLPILGSQDAIICLSPERFLQMSPDHVVTTQPIKGTTKRLSDKDDDRKCADALQHDEKNRAENLMIVDLLRNDLGKVCETGSVCAEKLFELQSFANVHHLVSTITGKLKQNLNGADLLHACFPGGSITGAPKIRAMQIIEEMEPTRRSIYCGTIAYFSAHGAMDSNITIRTLLLHNETIYCWGGGGIVADSDANSEYQETLMKIQTLLTALSGQDALPA
jgi:para-aminobenzoate synthetase component 1